jgi:two-component system chemotaxis response regulator CheY
MRTLIVEDDFTSRIVLQTFLSRYGDCHIAVNGMEAVEAFRDASARGQSYDLICMDILMPEMDGDEALRQIRSMENASAIEWEQQVKIIMITGLDRVKSVAEAFKSMCNAYLVKPVDTRKLLGLLDSFGLAH